MTGQRASNVYRAWVGVVVSGGAFALATAAYAVEWKSGIQWQEPPAVDPGGPAQAPSDAIVLFGGDDCSAFEGGENCKIEEGAFTIGNGGIRTKESFGDMQLHLEFATPSEVKGSGQGRGNSGVYLMGRYEVQILDSFDNVTYFDGQCASIYKQSPPLVNASRGPGQWQTYDIIFDAPRFAEDGSVAKPARVTVLHNGVLAQHAYELQGGTAYDHAPSYSKHADKLPLNIQYHGNPVRFRNIWVREFKPLEKTLPSEAEAEKPVEGDKP
ncbi:MAG: DUF1080 domain-containing protein [Planctomycetales bacterium]|nr:DUF1080 domain-containing protein [Planctomycetales bacterium]